MTTILKQDLLKVDAGALPISNNNANDQNLNINSIDIIQHQPTINIGTLGHVAHGKSSLAKALSTVQTAKFQMELSRNMTVKLGYANFKLWECSNPICPKPWRYKPTASTQMIPPICTRPTCSYEMNLIRHISLVDSPGHSDLLSTMLAGSSVMDSALLIISSDERCPAPQTAEHLAAASLMNLSNFIVVQNKIDLVSPKEAYNNQLEIREFIDNTPAENAPIVPISAVQSIGIDVICEKISDLPIPIRDLESPVRMSIVRSFDINKPGVPIQNIKGGVIGGSIVRGIVKIGDELEIRPGLVLANGIISPVRARVISLFSEQNPLKQAIPGGLIAVGLNLDPILTRADRLVGQIAGVINSLPPVFKVCTISYKLLRRIITNNNENSSSKNQKIVKPAKNEKLLLCIGSARVEGTIIGSNIKEKQCIIECKFPICAEINSPIALFRYTENRTWKLIGSGELLSVQEIKLTPIEYTLQKNILEQQQENSIVQLDQNIEKTIQNELENYNENQELWSEQEMNNEDDDNDQNESDLDDINHNNGENRTPNNTVNKDAASTPKVDRKLIDSAIIEQELSISRTESVTDCRMYCAECPSIGDIIMVKIISIEPSVGAYCELLEYNNLTGLIVLTEITNKLLKSLKQILTIGSIHAVQVIRVDSKKKFIDLSKRRVDSEDKKLAEENYAKNKLLYSILKRTAINTKFQLETIYKYVGWKLSELHELTPELAIKHPIDAFQAALHDPNLLFQAIGIEYPMNQTEFPLLFELQNSLLLNIEHRLKRKNLRLKCVIEATCFNSYLGIEAIKQALDTALKRVNSLYSIENNVPQELKENNDSGVENRVVTCITMSCCPYYSIVCEGLNKIRVESCINVLLEMMEKELHIRNASFAIKQAPLLFL